MKLLQILSSFPALAITTAIVFASNTALADQSHRNRNSNFGDKYSTGHNKNSFKRNTSDRRFNPSFRSTTKSRFSNNTRYSNNWNRQNNRRFGFFNNYPNRNNYSGAYFSNYRSIPYRQNSHWSVSLNLGSAYYGNPGAWLDSGFRSYSPFANQTRVVYNQPTVVYVNDNAPESGHVISRTSQRRTQPSLLRDINGYCFERSYDNQGIETRIQLPDSACNF